MKNEKDVDFTSFKKALIESGLTDNKSLSSQHHSAVNIDDWMTVQQALERKKSQDEGAATAGDNV